MLVLTPDVNKFFEEWSKPQTPNIVVTSTTKRNVPITAIVLFTGAKVINGNCEVRVDFIVLKPDGTEYGSQKNVPAWVNKPGPPKGIIQVSQGVLGIVIEPNDPPGTYRVKTIVYDIFGKLVLELEQPFTVIEAAA